MQAGTDFRGALPWPHQHAPNRPTAKPGFLVSATPHIEATGVHCPSLTGMRKNPPQPTLVSSAQPHRTLTSQGPTAPALPACIELPHSQAWYPRLDHTIPQCHRGRTGLRSPAARLQWQGWIKDYDSVTLMECRIDPLLPHTRLPDLFSRQRAALQQRMAAHSQSHVVRPGLPAGSQPVEVADIPGADLTRV